jgi:hypothetical protein
MTTGDQPVREEAEVSKTAAPADVSAGAVPAKTEETTALPDAPPPGSSVKEPTMDIHPPHAIRTFKDFLMALLTVFIGILLALGLESLVEWQHHRALVREARANLAVEIKANKETMSTYLQDIHQRQKDLHLIVATMRKLERTGKLSVDHLNYGYDVHTLYSAAWHAATTSGAVTYMKYDELRQYTDVYDTQQLFQTLEFQGFNTVTEIAPRMQVLYKNLKTVPVGRFEELEREAQKALWIMQALEALANASLDAYGKVSPQS